MRNARNPFFVRKAQATLGLVLFMVMFVQAVPTGARLPAERLQPELQERLSQLPERAQVRVIVRFRDQLPVKRDWGLGREPRLIRLVTALKAYASRSQTSLHKIVEQSVRSGEASNPVYFWIFNGLSVSLEPAAILELAAYPEVAWISLEQEFRIPDWSASTAPPQPNLLQIQAPAVWELGYRGQGVVVAALDSGVSMSHTDLISRWRAGDNSWYDPYNQHPDYPMDLNGHGTAVMGILVGGEESGTAIGVAPGARWIAARIYDDQGQSTETAIHQAMQWLLDPDGQADTADAPHVVNNSWSFAVPGCNLAFQTDLQVLVAAGILPIFAAGNYGPAESSDASPGKYPGALAVGAVDALDVVWPLSSRGPSDCDEPETVFPEVVAPGENIYTTDRAGSYTTRSGTSLAAPHAAGVLALLLSGYPGASPEEQRLALIQTGADLGPAGADNTYGYGRLNALAALEWLAENHKTPTPSPTPSPTPEPISTPTPILFFFPEGYQGYLP